MQKGGEGGLPKHDITQQLIRGGGGGVTQKMTINCHSAISSLENQLNSTQHNWVQSNNNVMVVLPQLLNHPKELLPLIC